jgi:hypothetical protein
VPGRRHADVAGAGTALAAFTQQPVLYFLSLVLFGITGPVVFLLGIYYIATRNKGS